MQNKKVKQVIGKVKDKKFIIPATVGIAVFIAICVALGMRPKVNTVEQANASEEVSSETVVSSTVMPDGQTLYTMDKKSVSQNNVAVKETGYQTTNKLGDGEVVSNLKNKLDDLEKNKTNNDTSDIKNDMRGKVDYDTMNNSIKNSASNSAKELKEKDATNTQEHAAIKKIIASNKNATDEQLRKLEAEIGSAQNSDVSINKAISNSQTSSQSDLVTLKKDTSNKFTEVNNNISSAKSANAAAVEDLKNTLTSTINTKVTELQNSMATGLNGAIKGTYSNNTLILSGGNTN